MDRQLNNAYVAVYICMDACCACVRMLVEGSYPRIHSPRVIAAAPCPSCVNALFNQFSDGLKKGGGVGLGFVFTEVRDSMPRG